MIAWMIAWMISWLMFNAVSVISQPFNGGLRSWSLQLCKPFLVIITTLSLADLCPGVEKKNFEEIMHFHSICILPRPSTRTSASGVGHDIFKLWRPFIGYHNYILILAPEGRKEDFKRNTAFSLHLNTRTPDPGVMKFTILVDLQFILCLSDLSLRVKRKILKKLCIFTIWLNYERASTRILAPGVVKFAISPSTLLNVQF